MIDFDLTFGLPAKNIACDQWMLDRAEREAIERERHLPSQGRGPVEYLRFWQPSNLFVVMGRSGKYLEEVHFQRCHEDGVEVLRRSSGGGTILTGPGCLMYSVVLSLEERPGLRDISKAHQFVGQKICQAFLDCGHAVELRGYSDVCLGDYKCSGNALRVGRNHLLYHGTLLLEFALEEIPYYLRMPNRRPRYRGSREHLEFVTNVPVAASELQKAIAQSFGTQRLPMEIDHQQLDHLVAVRYGQSDWNLKI